MSHREIFISGHGGQGVLELGNFFAYMALEKGERVVYTPSYGPETRGGKVRCYVLTDEEQIDSPIAEQPNLMIVMNEPSMDFVPLISPGGALLRNSSLAVREADRDDIQVLNLPITELAGNFNSSEFADLRGSVRGGRVVQNAVAFGAVLALLKVSVEDPAVLKSLETAFKSKPGAVPLNQAAVELGYAEAEHALADS